MTTKTLKTLRWTNIERGEYIWQRHFASRDASRTLVMPEGPIASEGHAPGLYIELPVYLAEAWDRALREVKARRDWTGEHGDAHIEAALDAAAAAKEAELIALANLLKPDPWR